MMQIRTCGHIFSRFSQQGIYPPARRKAQAGSGDYLLQAFERRKRVNVRCPSGLANWPKGVVKTFVRSSGYERHVFPSSWASSHQTKNEKIYVHRF